MDVDEMVDKAQLLYPKPTKGESKLTTTAGNTMVIDDFCNDDQERFINDKWSFGG